MLLVIPISSTEKHLGHVIGEKDGDRRITKAINELYISCNKISSEFSCMDTSYSRLIVIPSMGLKYLITLGTLLSICLPVENVLGTY